MDDSAVRRVLIVVAHPDDADFGAAGTVATWTDVGIEVVCCVVTDGAAGGFDPSVSRQAMASLRQVEQEAAAKTLGVQHVVFLGYPDGQLTPTIGLRRDVTRVIRRVRPDRVVCQSPERMWFRVQASHPDHMAAGEATLAAVYPDARNPFAFPELLDEGLEAHSVPEVWVMASPSSGRYVDITDTFDRKVAALRCHASQLPDPDALEPMLRGWAAFNAESAGMAAGRLAEAFMVVDTS